MYQRRLMAEILEVKYILLVIYFWLSTRFFTHESINRVLSLPMRHSNIDVCYVPSHINIRIELEVTIVFRKDASWWYNCIYIHYFWQIPRSAG